MANLDLTYKAVLNNEGGYNRAWRKSGETYKGIDRLYFPEWPGWAIIDAYKAQYGVPAEESTIPSAQLDEFVKQWYHAFLLRLGNIGAIQDQTLANMLSDFLVHKQYDAMKVVNYAANQLGVNSTSATKITPAVLDSMNKRPADFYQYLRNGRIAYYNNPGNFGSSLRFSPEVIKSFVKRVNTFPAYIKKDITVDEILQQSQQNTNPWQQ